MMCYKDTYFPLYLPMMQLQVKIVVILQRKTTQYKLEPATGIVFICCQCLYVASVYMLPVFICCYPILKIQSFSSHLNWFKLWNI